VLRCSLGRGNSVVGREEKNRCLRPIARALERSLSESPDHNDHASLRTDVVPERVRRLCEDVAQRCREGDARLVEFAFDLGVSKTEPHEYPALNYLRTGAADALFAVCVPIFGQPADGDLLASMLLTERTFAWVIVPALRALDLLPPSVGPRSFARGRALTLRERGFPLDAIARWLDSEGCLAPDATLGDWTRGEVAKFVREARSLAKQTTSSRRVVRHTVRLQASRRQRNQQRSAGTPDPR